MSYIRAHIRVNNPTEAAEFVSKLNSDGSTNSYVIENKDGKHRVNARSLLGVIYACADYSDSMYLVNDSEDGNFPSFINDYRVLA